MAIHVIHFEWNGGTYRLAVDTDQLAGMARQSVRNKSRRAVEGGGAFVVTPATAQAHAKWIAQQRSIDVDAGVDE